MKDVAPILNSRLRKGQAKVIKDFTWTMWVLLVIAVLATIFLSLGATSLSATLARFGGLLMIGGAAMLVGGLLGLIFAVPRNSRRQAAAAGAPVPDSGLAYSGNSNLEEISDWLTKMIVGIALINWRAIVQALQSLKRTFEGSLSIGSLTPQFAGMAGLGLVGVYLGLGFAFGYLWSRVYLPKLLSSAETPEIETLTSDQRLGVEIDDYLDGVSALPDDELQQLFRAASSRGRENAYIRIHRRLEEQIRDETPTDSLIPLYQALINLPGGRASPLNRAEYGVALLHAQQGQPAEINSMALNELRSWKQQLGVQPNIRGHPWTALFHAHYALSLIRSGSANTSEIRSSLEQASNDPGVRQWMAGQSELTSWQAPPADQSAR